MEGDKAAGRPGSPRPHHQAQHRRAGPDYWGVCRSHRHLTPNGACPFSPGEARWGRRWPCVKRGRSTRRRKNATSGQQGARREIVAATGVSTRHNRLLGLFPDIHQSPSEPTTSLLIDGGSTIGNNRMPLVIPALLSFTVSMRWALCCWSCPLCGVQWPRSGAICFRFQSSSSRPLTFV